MNIKVESVIGSALKHTSLGLSTLPGSPGIDLARKYIKMHLRDAILQDPRIDSVDNIVIYPRGTVIQATVFFRLVGYDQLLDLEVSL